MFLSLCYFNYYNFVDNYKSYKFVNSTNFFIPLKNNIKTTTDLYFYSDMSVNKFTKNIYKNLNSVNFLSNKDLCDCSANNSYFFVTEKKINDKGYVNFQIYIIANLQLIFIIYMKLDLIKMDSQY